MKQSLLFWPSLLGAFLDDDIFRKDNYVDGSKLLDFDHEKAEEDEEGYAFDFLPNTHINPEGIKISVKDGLLKIEYDEKGDNEEVHYHSSRTLPEDADIDTIQATTEGAGVRVTIKRLPPKKEDKKALSIPVKVVKPE